MGPTVSRGSADHISNPHEQHAESFMLAPLDAPVPDFHPWPTGSPTAKETCYDGYRWNEPISKSLCEKFDREKTQLISEYDQKMRDFSQDMGRATLSAREETDSLRT